jgi:hypothetical protein
MTRLSACTAQAGRLPYPFHIGLDDVSQIPAHDDHFYGDSQYSWDDYIEA